MHIGKPVRNFDAIEIAAPALKVFEYVTRPDLWHEWHPASTSADLPRIPLQKGDQFREIITVRYPLIRVRQQSEYSVVLSEPGKAWEVRGISSLFNLTIHYEFKPQGSDTLFERTLTYEVKGALAYFEPVLVGPKIRKQSAKALLNLKKQLESR